ncbi:MAG: VOC family protein, partial [Alkalibacterium gilvum]
KRPNVESYGYAHLAMSVGDKTAVDNLVDKLESDGYMLVDGPRTTGDGYYEAVIEDPEGNLIELTAE